MRHVSVIMSRTLLALACSLVAVVGQGRGQVFERTHPLPPAEVDMLDSASAAHLESAKRFIAEEQWAEAVEAIRRVMEADEGRLVKVDLALPLPGFERYVPATEFCQWRLAALAMEAPAALAHYRGLIDALAEGWLRQAIEEREPSGFERIINRAFASRFGDEALLRLGELALARGDFALARSSWERIHPTLTVTPAASAKLQSPVGSPLWPALKEFDFAQHGRDLAELFPVAGPVPAGVYPDTDLDLAGIAARLVVVSILENDLDRARVELERLRALYPEAEGQLGGQSGKLVDLLSHQFEAAQTWPPKRQSTDWTTFAGNFERAKTAADPVDIGGQPLWSFALPRLNADREMTGAGRLRVADDGKRVLSYFPVVANDRVLLRFDARTNSYVAALDLRTGSKVWQVDYRRGTQDPEPRLSNEPFEVNDAHADLTRHAGVARYTQTIVGNKAFLRMGSPISSPASRRLPQIVSSDQGFLLGLDLESEGKPLEGFPIRPESMAWAFEGTPVADEETLYVAMRRVDGARSQIYVAAFELQTTAVGAEDAEALGARPSGCMKWRTKICSGATPGGGDIDELTHLLLTMSEGTIYCNTNLGAVAAIDADNGHLQWLVKYPRSPFRTGDPDRNDEQFFRDLNPCLFYKGLLIVAPSDCDQIFALHAATGQLAWALPSGDCADVMHLLGIGEDCLLASGNWLYWIDIYSGRLLTQFPQPGPGGPTQAAPSPRGFGRGVLAGDSVYFPTREQLFVFQQRPLKSNFGWQPQLVRQIDLAPRGVTGGNVIVASGVLLIASGDKLVAFGQ